MGKRTITVDADDMAGSFDKAAKILQDVSGDEMDVRNLDAFFDVITEYGSGLRIVVRNAGHLTPDARRMLEDALANSSGLEVVLTE